MPYNEPLGYLVRALYTTHERHTMLHETAFADNRPYAIRLSVDLANEIRSTIPCIDFRVTIIDLDTDRTMALHTKLDGFDFDTNHNPTA